MKTRNTILVSGLILVLAGVFTWRFFGQKSTQPAITAKVAMLASTLVKPLDIKSATAVEAPKVAAVTPKDAPPAVFTPEDKAWVDGQIQAMEMAAPMIKDSSERYIATARDDATQAKLEKLEQDMTAQAQKQMEQLRNAKPPEDLGEIPVAELPEAPGMQVPPTAPKFILAGGETFTLALNLGSLLISEQDVPGTTGPYAGKHYHRLTIGEPTILLLHDGALAKFTLVETMR